jgi:enoyl-CoA hydratase
MLNTLSRRLTRQFTSSTARLAPTFEQVLHHFRASGQELNDKEKLEFYGLYKVATLGPVQGSQPSAISFVKRAKWDSWNTVANDMDQSQAQQMYMQRACEVMGLTLDDIDLSANSKSADVQDVQDVNAKITTSPTTPPFRHRDIREICGLRSNQAVSSKLEERAKEYTCLSVNVEKDTGVGIVNLSRASKMNAMNIPLWEEILDVFQICNDDPMIKCVVLGADGDHFCSGMDLGVFAEMSDIYGEETCDGRSREMLSTIIQYFQDGCSSPEHCNVPVLAAIHGNAIGGAIDLLTSCDMRYCVDDSMFCVKEVDLGIVADVGTTQRLPKLVGDQRARELTYTARSIDGKEAESIGLVLNSFPTKDEMLQHVMNVARTIASKSPLTVRGIKHVSLYNRDHPNVDVGLKHVKAYNTSYLFSEDLTEAANAMMSKRKPVFKKN